jgi:hypothetical protein
MNRSILSLLRTFVNESSNWESILGPVLFAYRTAVHSSTGFSPNDIMFARAPPRVVENITTNWGYDPSYWRRITAYNYQRIEKEVLQNITEARVRQKNNYDKSAYVEELQVGEEVWLRRLQRPNKLTPVWARGWKINKIISDKLVVLAGKEGREIVVIG